MANEKHIELVLHGQTAIQNWRSQHQNERLDLREARLPKIDLSSANLNDADFSDADLRHADLSRAHFSGANLRRANLSGANLRQAVFSRADLRRADLSDAHLIGANFSGAILRRADLSGAHFSVARPNDPNDPLKGAGFNDANLYDANLRGAILTGLNFTNAILSDANLSDADLRRADLIGADLSGANLSRANLSSADLRGADLFRADLSSAVFNRADLSGADFTNVYLDSKTSFESVNVNGDTHGLSVWVLNPDNYIVREIKFPPAQRQAGIGMIHHFAEVMWHKYPDIPTTVQITQDRLTVRMTVETETAHRETVEETLDAYGLVVSGTLSPEAFFDNQLDVSALQHTLDMMQRTWRHARERLQSQAGQPQQRRTHETAIDEEWQQFRDVLGAQLHSQDLATLLRTIRTLLEPISNQDEAAVQQALETLIQAARWGVTAEEKKNVTEALTTFGELVPAMYRAIWNAMTKTLAPAAAGNAFYDCLVQVGKRLGF